MPVYGLLSRFAVHYCIVTIEIGKLTRMKTCFNSKNMLLSYSEKRMLHSCPAVSSPTSAPYSQLVNLESNYWFGIMLILSSMKMGVQAC